MKRRRTQTDYIFLSGGGVITAQSVPDLDDWGWDSFWDCADWITWHKALAQAYGKDAALLKFATEWNKQGMGAHALGCRTVDSDFRTYINSVGLYDVVWQSAGGFKYVLQPIGSVMQTAGNVGGGLLKGLDTTTTTFKYLVPALLTAVVLGVAIYGYRTVTRRRV